MTLFTSPRRLIWILCLISLTVLPVAAAQSTFGAFTGTITDASGAIVPGATVTATRLGTEAASTTVTDSAGVFQPLNLDPGRYRLVVSLPGFREETREVELLARQTVRVDLPLSPAGTQESVTVTAMRPAVETDRATIDASRSGDEISKLALNFRATNNTSPIVVATLTQGVQQDRGGNLAVAGSLPFMTSFSVDGISTQQIRSGGPSRELFPSWNRSKSTIQRLPPTSTRQRSCGPGTTSAASGTPKSARSSVLAPRCSP